ncbi:V-type ATP synthase subunit I [Halobacteria archaeon AArc-curdl1]|uniref:A-type ATP synthase subunit I n=1 Tax=Natronosalvus hydrolyticus TaxID=2979988 RepID=A0AAP2Z5F9_9EURY|nr:V-type ATP synthase subunit I [Halobacteria archaeon AArc-curdl1]
MLRPEQMSKVSLTGSKSVMVPVIEAVHDLNLVHLSDYDGTWEGFDNGNPVEGADESSEKLVTVRSLESILDISEEDAGPGRLPDDWETRLEDVRRKVNALDDERSEIREERRQVQEKIDRVAPFAELGIDLDLLSGYDSVDVLVGEGPTSDVEAALEAAADIRAFETFTGGNVIAIVAAPSADADDDAAIIDDALVGIEFSRYPVPETDENPENYVEDLELRKQQLEADLEEIDSNLEAIKLDEAGFLLRLEEELSIEVQKADAPLQFATTNRAFVAEGWIPTGEYDALVARLNDAVGDSVEVEELERASYDRHGAHSHTEEVQDEESGDDGDGTEYDSPPPKQPATDGGYVTMDDEPPTRQSNPKAANPFEELVQVISRPKYSEVDPTIILWMTFPLFFGFMISDVGYGALYVLIGYYLYKNLDGMLGSLGMVAIWCGSFTVLFGFLFGEFFGFHFLGDMIPGDIGGWYKGLDPYSSDFALAWLVVSVLFGVAHLNIGYVLDFVDNISHGLWDAITHSVSWILLLNGIWIWVFTHQASADKPDFLFSVFDGQPFNIGFNGFGEGSIWMLGAPIPLPGGGEFLFTLPLVMILLGAILLGIGDAIELVEILIPFAHVLSYTRMTAVLLAKGGMAFVVNLLTFGAWETQEGQRMFDAGWEESIPYGSSEMMFEGLFHMGDGASAIAFILLGIIVLIFGHILVLLLGITSAGLQGIRLEYVEFFGKFYEGGGKNYEPFGYDRNHSED